MSLPTPDRESGLLPEGAHGSTWDELRDVFVIRAPKEQQISRSAVCIALKAWALAAMEHLGSGTLLVSGGFVTYSEPTWAATAAYVPTDETGLARAVEDQGPYWQLVSVSDVFFSDPEPGGYLRKRTSVGGLVDAVVIKDADRQLAHRILSISDSARPIGYARKGYVEVVIQP